MYTITKRQFDIPLTTGYHYSIPRDVKGRETKEDFIQFIIDNNIDKNDYYVCVQSTVGSIRSIDILKSIVRLPHVIFAEDNFILLLSNSNKPPFIGTIKRGRTYIVSYNNLQKNGYYILK